MAFIGIGSITEFCVPDHWSQAAVMGKFSFFPPKSGPFPDHFFNFSGLLVVLSIYIVKKVAKGVENGKKIINKYQTTYVHLDF